MSVPPMAALNERQFQDLRTYQSHPGLRGRMDESENTAMSNRVANCVGLLLLVVPNLALAMDKGDYFAISVVDDQTGRGVPLVQLKTTNDVCYYTDSNGLVA